MHLSLASPNGVGGGGDPGSHVGEWGLCGNFATNSGHWWGKCGGLDLKMAQLSGKIWGRSHHLARELGLRVVQ